jgi:hypothetical protein
MDLNGTRSSVTVPFVLKLLDHARRDLVARLDDDLAGGGVDQVKGRPGPRDATREELGHPLAGLRLEPEVHRLEVGRHDRFLVEPHGVQERRHRQLAAAVDARVDEVLGVELEVEPGAAVRE